MRKIVVCAALVPITLGVFALATSGLGAASGPGRENAPRVRPAALSKPQPPALTGPVIDATRLGAPLLLDKDWRIGVTADPAASQPGFDDSNWVIRSAGQSMDGVTEAAEGSVPSGDVANAIGIQAGDVHAHVPRGFAGEPHHRFAWFRLHIRLAPDHGPIALFIELPVSRTTTLGTDSTEPAVNVFANGRHILPTGPHADRVQHYQDISRIYDLNVPPSQTDLTLAVRTLNIPFGHGAYTGFFTDRTLRLGNPGDLQRYAALWSDRNLFERLPRLVYSVLLFVLSAFLLALYFAQKGHNEYLWLALHYLVQAPVGFVELAGSSGHLDNLWYRALVWQLLLVSAYLFFEFLVSFLALRHRWYIRGLRYTAPVLGGVAPVLLLAGRSALGGDVHLAVFAVSLLWMIGWLIFMFSTLIAATLRRNFEAGLLLIPLLLSLLGSIEPVMTAGMSDFMGRPYRSPLTLTAGPIPIHLASIADFTGVLVIVIIIFGRYLRIQREQQRATSELAAARSVQELMIPREKIVTPGFEVISIYDPAAEVGGDFFHVQALADGNVLAIIGDVAGKGLKAAMNVSMIMGALRRTADQSPARILEDLNRVLLGSESFTTCQAACFAPGGELVLANAGHLPPYLNSQEIAVPGGLPLGVVPDLKYEEIRVRFNPGDRILFLSDGVVEARKPSGELFGFDRVHAMAMQSAGYIADAAKTFGQMDDITVLTVQRLAPVKPVQDTVDTLRKLSTATAG